MRGGDDDVLAAEDMIAIARLGDVVLAQIVGVVVRGVATYAEVIEEFSHVPGLGLGPVEVGRVEFDALVAHLRDRAHGALEILLQGSAHGVEFEADRNG